MFEIQTGTKNKTAFSSENATEIVNKFVEVYDSHSQIRIVRHGEVLARKTPKTTYLAPVWR